MLEALLAWQLQALPSRLRCSRIVDAANGRIGTHGDVPSWDRALKALPVAPVKRAHFGDCVAIDLDGGTSLNAVLRDALMQLRPWRKGPFRLHGVRMDAEWRSDLKWRRLSSIYPRIKGARILDVGCGNGYYGWRLLECGAQSVVGIDHNPLCAAQHLAIQRYLRDARNLVLPLSLNELPDAWAGFDLAFSMGVLSHSRDPRRHLAELQSRLRTGGVLVIESLVLGCGAGELRPGHRYARMRNVWRLPGAARLRAWIEAAGFTQIELLGIARTSTGEQRSTAWMPFASLADSLNLSDSSRTLEGLPAPRRAIFKATRP